MSFYFRHKLLLNSARNCLRYLVKTYKIKEINLPYYICPVIWQELRKENVRIKFYHIDKNFMPTKDFKESDFILYPNYFGICGCQNSELTNRYEFLISDNAHSFFAEPKGFAAFYSPRKFVDVNDGGILYCNRSLDMILERDFDRIIDVSCYENFVKNELSVDNQEIKFMSLKTENFLRENSFENIKVFRREKFVRINNILAEFNRLEISIPDDDVPMVYPFLSESFEMLEKIVEKAREKNIFFIKFGTEVRRIFLEYDFDQIILPIPLKSEMVDILAEIINIS